MEDKSSKQRSVLSRLAEFLFGADADESQESQSPDQEIESSAVSASVQEDTGIPPQGAPSTATVEKDDY